MSTFAILLIEDQLSMAVTLAQVIGQHLNYYCLSISKSMADTVAEPESPQVILLNAAQLSDDIWASLAPLVTVYPDIPIILLLEPSWPAEEELLLTALSAGVNDYLILTPAGLLGLGRKLVTLQRQLEPRLGPTSGELLYKAMSSDTSQLAIQLIGPDNHIQAWNRATELLFGFERPQVRSFHLTDLPLAAPHLQGLKEVLEQVRQTGEPLFLPSYSLENQQKEQRWVQLYIYPIEDLAFQPEEYLSDICIISVDVTDLKQTEIKNWHYSQELQILLETSRQISGRLELLPTLEKIIEQTKTLLNADSGRVYLLAKDQQTLQPIVSIGPVADQTYPTPIIIGQGTIGAIAAMAQAAMINFVGLRDNTYHKNEHLLCVPLIPQTDMLGVMVLYRFEKAPFMTDDLRFFESIVQQVSSAINNARLFEETQQTLKELAILYEATSAIATARDTQSVLNILIQQMVQALDISSGHIASWDKSQHIGSIQAEFLRNRSSESEMGFTFNLAARPALLAMINQQQPVVFQLSDAGLDEIEQSEMARRGCFSRLLVPLVIKSEAIGWADLWESRREHIFSADEIRLARTLSNQAAVALENVQYLKQTQQALEETAALYQVASALATLQDNQSIMSMVLREYLRVLDLKQGNVVIFDFETKFGVVKVNFQDDEAETYEPPAEATGSDEEIQERWGRGGLEGRQIPLKNNWIYKQLMRSHQPVVIKDTRAAGSPPPPNASPSPPTRAGESWGSPTALSILVVPIQIRGEIIGAIVVEATHYPHNFNKWEISLGQAMADQLGIALQNVKLYELEYQRRQQAETLREVSFVVGSSLNLNEVLERILDQLGRVVKYDSAAIHLIEGNRRRIIAGRGFPNPKKIIGLTLPVALDSDSDPGSVVIHTHQPQVVGNVPAVYDHFRKSSQDHIKSWMGLPLIARDKLIGLISIDHIEPNAYNEEDLQLALAFANQVAIALENARLYEIEVQELERELEIAHGIQETLLPQFVPEIPGLQISGRILPARQIGGDFFHFFSVGEGRLGIAIGDVSGKGIPAALYMAVAITAIDAQIRVDLAPGELLNKLNHILYHRLQENKMNIGLQVATFAPLSVVPDRPEPEKRIEGIVMTVSSAGMIAPIGANRHGCRFLPVSGLPVGALAPPEQIYKNDVFLLDPFSTIIFTSDGIVEAQNEARELFGFERLEATINEIIGTQDAEVIAEHIIQQAQEFVGQAEQNDDMTVVVVVKT